MCAYIFRNASTSSLEGLPAYFKIGGGIGGPNTTWIPAVDENNRFNKFQYVFWKYGRRWNDLDCLELPQNIKFYIDFGWIVFVKPSSSP